jgi:Uma2 family endonuclease
MSATPLRKTILYPDSDGLPMADNDLQYRAMVDLRYSLETRYAGDPDVYVGANLLLYYREGDPGASVSPDVFVAFGVGKGDRRSYLVWEEGRAPVLAFEIASQTSWQTLLGKKKDLYERLGIDEYVVFDPDGELLQPRLQGFRLKDGRYRPLPLEPDGSLVSPATGLRFEPEGVKLRVVDVASGKRFPWIEEESEARARAEEQATREAAARRLAEEQAAREAAARQSLEDELARLRAGLESRERND